MVQKPSRLDFYWTNPAANDPKACSTGKMSTPQVVSFPANKTSTIARTGQASNLLDGHLTTKGFTAKIISRYHAQIKWENGSPLLSDLTSTHGTFVSRRQAALVGTSWFDTVPTAPLVRIKKSFQLQDGDFVAFGSIVSKAGQVFYPVQGYVHIVYDFSEPKPNRKDRVSVYSFVDSDDEDPLQDGHDHSIIHSYTSSDQNSPPTSPVSVAQSKQVSPDRSIASQVSDQSKVLPRNLSQDGDERELEVELKRLKQEALDFIDLGADRFIAGPVSVSVPGLDLDLDADSHSDSSSDSSSDSDSEVEPENYGQKVSDIESHSTHSDEEQVSEYELGQNHRDEKEEIVPNAEEIAVPNPATECADQAAMEDVTVAVNPSGSIIVVEKSLAAIAGVKRKAQEYEEQEGHPSNQEEDSLLQQEQEKYEQPSTTADSADVTVSAQEIPKITESSSCVSNDPSFETISCKTTTPISSVFETITLPDELPSESTSVASDTSDQPPSPKRQCLNGAVQPLPTATNADVDVPSDDGNENAAIDAPPLPSSISVAKSAISTIAPVTTRPSEAALESARSRWRRSLQLIAAGALGGSALTFIGLANLGSRYA